MRETNNEKNKIIKKYILGGDLEANKARQGVFGML